MKPKTHISLDWIDDYIKKIKPYIFVRAVDNVLIKIPNRAFKLNKSAVAILKFLLYKNGSIKDVVKLRNDEKALSDLYCFFKNLQLFLSGKKVRCLGSVETENISIPFSDYPILSEIALTYKCTLRCSFCYASCNCTTNYNTTYEMTTSDVISVMKKIRYEAEVPSLSFTGGEPTLRSDLFKLIESAKGMGLWVNLITNGTLITRDFAKKLKSLGVDSVQVSLEGSNEEVHSSLTGVRGSYEKTLNGIRNLNDNCLNVHTNTTISRGNLHNLESICNLVKSLGLKRLSMNLLIPTGSAQLNSQLVVKYSEVGAHLTRLKNVAKEIGIEFLWYSPTPICIYNPIVEGFGNKGCSACEGLLSVAPNGDVLPCSSFPEPLGNLLDDDFKKIWFGEKAKFFRYKNYANESCKRCDRFNVCNSACPLYWNALGFSELKDNLCEQHQR